MGTTAFNGNCVAQTVAGTCTKNLLAGGARFTAATPTKDSFCAPCAPGSYGPADGSADCLIHTPCGNQLATTGALCAADSRLTGATETAAGVCDACAANTYGVNGAANCALNVVCGKQVGGATRVNAAATREVAGTCNACAADTWALNIGDDCVANTVCGFAVGTAGAKRASDASRTVAGTCANCAANSFDATTAFNASCAPGSYGPADEPAGSPPAGSGVSAANTATVGFASVVLAVVAA